MSTCIAICIAYRICRDIVIRNATRTNREMVISPCRARSFRVVKPVRRVYVDDNSLRL